jgi:peptidoglycan/LPS O-acetylase OafA/YrhL
MILPSSSSSHPLLYKGGKDIAALQMLKALCIFLVVQHHICSCIGFALLPFRISVPTFYMITGYFLIGSDGMLHTEKIKRSIIKLLKLTAKIQAIYIAYFILSNLNDPQLLKSTLLSWQTWAKTIFICGPFGYQLWYLPALIEALVVILIAAKYNRCHRLLILSVVGIMLNFILGYFSPTEHQLALYRNFLTDAIPFIYIGMVLRLNEHHITLKLKTLVMLLVGAMILLYLENAFIKPHPWGDLVFMTIPVTLLFFIISLKAVHIGNNPIAVLGRLHSSNIFFYHILVSYLLEDFVKLCNLSSYNSTIYAWEAFIVYFLTLLLSCALRAVSLVR